LRIFAAFFLTSAPSPAPRAVFSSKRVKGFLENAGQRDLLAQFQSIEAEMASRMKSECFMRIFRVFEFLDFPDPDPLLFVWIRSGSFHHQTKTLRKTLISAVLWLPGVYILVENGYLFPPPSEIYIFSPKKQRDFRATLPPTK
jgi:hypothetical protein